VINTQIEILKNFFITIPPRINSNAAQQRAISILPGIYQELL